MKDSISQGYSDSPFIGTEDRLATLQNLINTNRGSFETMLALEKKNSQIVELKRRIEALRSKIISTSNEIRLVEKEQVLVGSKYNELVERRARGLSFSGLELTDLRKDIEFRAGRLSQRQAMRTTYEKRLLLLEPKRFDLQQKLDIEVFDFEQLCKKKGVIPAQLRLDYPRWQKEIEELSKQLKLISEEKTRIKRSFSAA